MDRRPRSSPTRLTLSRPCGSSGSREHRRCRWPRGPCGWSSDTTTTAGCCRDDRNRHLGERKAASFFASTRPRWLRMAHSFNRVGNAPRVGKSRRTLLARPAGHAVTRVNAHRVRYKTEFLVMAGDAKETPPCSRPTSPSCAYWPCWPPAVRQRGRGSRPADQRLHHDRHGGRSRRARLRAVDRPGVTLLRPRQGLPDPRGERSHRRLRPGRGHRIPGGRRARPGAIDPKLLDPRRIRP